MVREASIRLEGTTDSEWGEKYLLINHEFKIDGTVYRTTSGFAAEKLLETMVLQTCTSRSLIEDRDPEKFEVVKVADFLTGTDSRKMYLIHVITNSRDNAYGSQVINGIHEVYAKYRGLHFSIHALRMKDTGLIVAIEGKLDGDVCRPLYEAEPICGNVYFAIEQNFLFFTNSIRCRDRDPNGNLPSFRQCNGPGPDDFEIIEHTWWKDLGVNTPMVWQPIRPGQTS